MPVPRLQFAKNALHFFEVNTPRDFVKHIYVRGNTIDEQHIIFCAITRASG